MNTPRPKHDEELGLKRPALYNPALWSADELRQYFVARTALLARLVDDLRREQAGSSPQHRLILGMRGMGKSTLLRRLALAVSDDEALNAHWLPLSFPEEQYNVANLADFWLNCLDALGDLLEARGQTEEMEAIDNEVERLVRGDSEGALQALLRISARLGKRLLLLVDNIDLIFDRIKDKDWQFREALQAHPELLLVGASSRAMESTYEYRAAFYDFFKIDELKGLSEEEMRETIFNLARLRGAQEIIDRLTADPARLRVLHTLTGGNPRTAVLLYGVLLKGIDGDVRSDLEGLLDEVTPLYKARFEELPTQAQQLLDKVALNWDPISANKLASQLDWKVNLVSAQLQRLADAGIVEKVRSSSGKRMSFQVSERFFNIWYLMRTSRRVRKQLMWLVRYLQSSYSQEELETYAKRYLNLSPSTSVRDAETMLTLSEAIGRKPISLALEMEAIKILTTHNWEDGIKSFDLQGEDAHLRLRIANMTIKKAIRENLNKLLPESNEKEKTISTIAGIPLLPHEALAYLEEIEQYPPTAITKLAEFHQRELSIHISEELAKKLTYHIANGDLISLNDISGAKAIQEKTGDESVLLLTTLIDCAPQEEDHSKKIKRIAKKLTEKYPLNFTAWAFLINNKNTTENEQQNLFDEVAKTPEFNAYRKSTIFNFGIATTAALRLWHITTTEDVGTEIRMKSMEKLLASERISPRYILEIVKSAKTQNNAAQLLKEIDQTEAATKYRPFREALQVLADQSPNHLLDVAPEVRKPALDLLRHVAPEIIEGFA